MDNLRQLSGTGKLPGLSRNVPLGLYPGKGFITGGRALIYPGKGLISGERAYNWGKGFNISGERAYNRGKGFNISGERAYNRGKGFNISGERAYNRGKDLYPGKGLITGLAFKTSHIAVTIKISFTFTG